MGGASSQTTGAIPVFYAPLTDNPEGLEGLAAAMLASLGEVQELLVRLVRLKAAVRNSARPQDASRLSQEWKGGRQFKMYQWRSC